LKDKSDNSAFIRKCGIIEDKEGKTMLSDKVMQVFEQYNGTLPVKVAQAHGIDKDTLRKAFDRGDIERPRRGVYVLPDALEDEYFSLQSIYTKGIFSSLSAFELQNLSTVLSSYFYITFPQGYNKNFNQTDILAKIAPKDEYLLGVETVRTPEGNPVKTYNKERIIVDILRKTTPPTYEEKEALYDYFSAPEDLERLYDYAKFFGIENQVKQMEVRYA